MANKFFWDYGATDNSDDEDLQSRLYAEIYYAPNEQGTSETKDDVENEIPAVAERQATEIKKDECGKAKDKVSDLNGSFVKTKVPDQEGSNSSPDTDNNLHLPAEDVKPSVTALDAELAEKKSALKSDNLVEGGIDKRSSETRTMLKEHHMADVKPPACCTTTETLTSNENAPELHKDTSANNNITVKSEIEPETEEGTTEAKSPRTTVNMPNTNRDTETRNVAEVQEKLPEIKGDSCKIKKDPPDVKRDSSQVKEELPEVTEDEPIIPECIENETEDINTENEAEEFNKQRRKKADNILNKYDFSKSFINELYVKKYEELQQKLKEEEERQRIERLRLVQTQEISESSDENTKYAVKDKHEKEKQTPTKQNRKNKTTLEDESDSEDSILEVPIPPKPQPPVINLQDSDEDILISSDSDSDAECIPLEDIDNKKAEAAISPLSKKARSPLAAKQKENAKRKIGRSISDSCSSATSDSIDDIAITNINEDIMLHCTEVQKGASSIKEIQEMSKNVKKTKNAEQSELDKSDSCKGSSNKEKSSPNSKEKRKSTAIAGPSQENVLLESNSDNKKDTEGDVVASCSNEVNPNKRKQCDDGNDVFATPKRAKHSSSDTRNKNKESGTEEQQNQRKRKREETWEEYIFRPMSEKLKAFYTESRGQENFDIIEIQRNMSKDPKMWAILDDDLIPSFPKRQRFWNVKCNNCQREGHQRHNCPEPFKPVRCHMCGITGHTEVRCPRKMCLTCGKKQGTFRKTCESCRVLYCSMCKAVGHKSTECPDLWRRFHHTTRINDINVPRNLNEIMKPADLLVCCNCTKRGHDSSTCTEYRWSPHFPTPAYVSNYKDGPTYPPGRPKRSQPSQSQTSSPSQQQPSKPSQSSEAQPSKFSQPSQSQQLSQPQTHTVAQTPKSAQPTATQASDKIDFPIDEHGNRIVYVYGKYTSAQPMQEYIKHISKNRMKLEGFLQGQVTPTFYHELRIHLQVTFEVSFYFHPNDRMMLRVRSHSARFGKFLYTLSTHWLQLLDDEKEHAMIIQLPTCTDKMIELLTSKLPELERTYDVKELLSQIDLHKSDLKVTKDPSQRMKLMQDIADCQSKLVKMKQTKPCIVDTVGRMRKVIGLLESRKTRKIEEDQFVNVLILYNKLFSCYTPPYTIMDALMEKRSDRRERRSNRLKVITQRQLEKQQREANLANSSQQMAPQFNQQFDQQFNQQINQQFNQQVNLQYEPQINQQFNQQVNLHYDRQINQQFIPQVNQQFNPQANQQFNPQANQQFNPQANQQLHQRGNQQFNQQFNQHFPQQYSDQFGPQITMDPSILHPGNNPYAYPIEPVPLPCNNESRIREAAYRVNPSNPNSINLHANKRQTYNEPQPNRETIVEPSSNKDDYIEIISVQNRGNEEGLAQQHSGNRVSNKASTSVAGRSQAPAPANNNKNKSKKAKNVNLANAFLHVGENKATMQQKALLHRAQKVLANAFAFQLPYMTKAAAEVSKRISDNTLKQKHIDVLQRLINLEKSHQKHVNSVSSYLG